MAAYARLSSTYGSLRPIKQHLWQLTPFEHNIAIFQGYFKCYNEISLDFPLLAPADFSAWALGVEIC